MSETKTVNQVIIVKNQKSILAAAFLSLIFGPLGLIYVSIPFALISFVIVMPILLFTGGLGVFVTAPTCSMLGAFLAYRSNKSAVSVNVTRKSSKKKKKKVVKKVLKKAA